MAQTAPLRNPSQLSFAASLHSMAVFSARLTAETDQQIKRRGPARHRLGQESPRVAPAYKTSANQVWTCTKNAAEFFPLLFPPTSVDISLAEDVHGDILFTCYCSHSTDADDPLSPRTSPATVQECTRRQISLEYTTRSLCNLRANPLTRENNCLPPTPPNTHKKVRKNKKTKGQMGERGR